MCVRCNVFVGGRGRGMNVWGERECVRDRVWGKGGGGDPCLIRALILLES